MRLSDFDYKLPEELIAQAPLKNRDESRMLLLDKKTGNIEHLKFPDIINLLNPSDVIVLNDTKVFNARLIGRRKGHTGKIEVLILKQLNNGFR